MAAKYILAHDLGTSGDKASLFTTDGDFVATVTTGYPKTSFPDGGVEQDPEDWWKAFCLSTKQLLANIDPHDILVVGFDGTFPCCLCLDSHGNKLHNAFIWQDVRAAAESMELEAAMPKDWMSTFTNSRIGADKTLPKLLWIKRHWPEMFERIAMVLPSSQDFLVRRLTGETVTDCRGASGSRMINEDRTAWYPGALDLLGMKVSQLPRLVNRTDIVGGILPEIAEECGLVAGTPVVAGTGDSLAADVGVGLLDIGDAYFTGGTSGGIYGMMDVDGRPTRCGGEASACGASYAWLKDVICTQEQAEAARTGVSVYDLINEQAAAAPIGSHGVMFHPHLSGERFPRFNGMAQGSFVGISVTTTRADLIRSVIEGIGFNVALIMDFVRERGVNPRRIPIVGGLGTSPVTRQIFADIMNVELEVPRYPAEVATMGTAILAGIAIGVFANEREGYERFHDVASITYPNPSNVEMYQALRPIFDGIYHGLEPMYPDIYATRKWLSEQS